MAGYRLANSRKARSGRVPTPAQVSIGADISTPRDCGQMTEARRAPTNFGTAPGSSNAKKIRLRTLQRQKHEARQSTVLGTYQSPA
jgi:hypothetical protein